jgi:Pentapeptide repeats (8 copies)
MRLGGIYALEWIATSSPGNRRTVANILTAHVRRHAAWTAGPAQRAQISRPPPTPLADRARLEARAPDIQAALTVLGRLVGPEEDMATVVDRLQLFDTDLRGAFSIGANLQAALLGGAHLQGASLRDADLPRALLVYAQLSDVSLHGTDLRGADLRPAQVEGARHLEHADLRGAVADTKTRWPAGFDAAAAGVQLGANYN